MDVNPGFTPNLGQMLLTSRSEEPLGFWVKNWYFQTEQGSIPEPQASERGCSIIPPTQLGQKYVLTIILGRAVLNKFQNRPLKSELHIRTKKKYHITL